MGKKQNLQEKFGRIIKVAKARETFEKYPFVGGLWDEVRWRQRRIAKARIMPIGVKFYEAFDKILSPFVEPRAFRYVNKGFDDHFTDGAGGLSERLDLIIGKHRDDPNIEVTLGGGAGYEPLISPLCGTFYNLFIGLNHDGKDIEFEPYDASKTQNGRLVVAGRVLDDRDSQFPLRSKEYGAKVFAAGKSLNLDPSNPEIDVKVEDENLKEATNSVISYLQQYASLAEKESA